MNATSMRLGALQLVFAKIKEDMEDDAISISPSILSAPNGR